MGVPAGDVENYLTLWNKDFRGWPCNDVHPATKANIGDWVREIVDERVKSRSYNHRLMGYNNDLTTKLEDVRTLFAEAIARIK
jgi:hypothetical protein